MSMVWYMDEGRISSN